MQASFSAYLPPGGDGSDLLCFAYCRNLLRSLADLHLLTEEERCRIESVCAEHYKIELFDV